MATLRDIRRRIGSVQNTMQITSAMKMVSTAKLARAQNAVRAAQPYAEVLRRMVISLSRGLTGEDHPFLAEPEEGATVVLLFTSDRGLCGAFNANLNKELFRRLGSDPALSGAELSVFGRKGHEFFHRRGFSIKQSVVQVPEAERAARIPEVMGELIERFSSGEVARVLLAYNHFHSPINQVPRIVPLLPITPPGAGEGEEEGITKESTEENTEDRETLFEPSQSEVLQQLLPNYLENQCLLAHLNTEAGEHGARMVAMDGASRNAGEMIRSLTLEMNKARQTAITNELIEIVNGAQAL